jgi:undecaprenyl-diphosphatase
MSTLLQLNYSVFQEINTPAGTNPWLDILMIFCANWLIFFFPVILIILWGRPLRWRKRPIRPGEAELLQESRAVVLWIGIACLIAYALNLLIEQFLFEPRPFVTHRIHLLITHTADSSFPSDHSAWAFAVVGLLLLQLLPACFRIWRKQRTGQDESHFAILVWPCFLTGVAVVMACSIGLSRIFVGVHYPGDIVGGLIDGLVAAAIVTVLYQMLRQPTSVVLRFAYTLHLA